MAGPRPLFQAAAGRGLCWEGQTPLPAPQPEQPLPGTPSEQRAEGFPQNTPCTSRGLGGRWGSEGPKLPRLGDSGGWRSFCSAALQVGAPEVAARQHRLGDAPELCKMHSLGPGAERGSCSDFTLGLGQCHTGGVRRARGPGRTSTSLGPTPCCPPPCPHVNSGIYQFCTEIAAHILHLFFGFAAGSDGLRLHSVGRGGKRGRGNAVSRSSGSGPQHPWGQVAPHAAHVSLKPRHPSWLLQPRAGTPTRAATSQTVGRAAQGSPPSGLRPHPLSLWGRGLRSRTPEHRASGKREATGEGVVLRGRPPGFPMGL